MKMPPGSSEKAGVGAGKWGDRNRACHLMGCVRRAVFRSSTTWFLVSVSSSSNAYRLCICGRQSGAGVTRGCLCPGLLHPGLAGGTALASGRALLKQRHTLRRLGFGPQTSFSSSVQWGDLLAQAWVRSKWSINI